MSRSSNRSARCGLALLLAGLALMAVVPSADADVVEPFRVQLREQESGVFRVQWQAPGNFPLAMVPQPVPPEVCRARGSAQVEELQGSWLLRSVWDCPAGLHGQELVIAFAYVNTDRTTLLRLGLETGEQWVQILAPGEDRWRIPDREVSFGEDPWSSLRQGLLDGVLHALATGLHLLFLGCLMLVGRREILAQVGQFSGGQLVAVAVTSFSGVTVGEAVAESSLAIAAVLLAAGAMAEPSRRPVSGGQTVGLMAAVGLVHGLGLSVTLPPPRVFEGLAWVYSVVAVVGMDAVLLVLCIGGVMALSALRDPLRTRLVQGLAYAVGGGAVAGLLLLLGAVPGSIQRPGPGQPASPLPQLASASSTQGSSAVFAQTAVQSFVSVEGLEVRHEVLVRLADFVEALGISNVADSEGIIAVDRQAAIKARVEELVKTSTRMMVDGALVEPVVERVDFLSVGFTGVLPRADPIDEPVLEAFVGVTLIFPTLQTPRDLVLEWISLPPGQTELAATITDPEASRSALLSSRDPTMEWLNQLSEDPIPSVQSIAVTARQLRLPMLGMTILLLGVIGLFGVKRFRLPDEGLGPAGSRVALIRLACALAILVAPMGQWSIALPGASVPSVLQARRVLAKILPNVYRALEYREEAMAFDRLAVSVSGDALSEVYLEHRRGLEMEERGGARARVESVEVPEVSRVTAIPGGGFEAEAVWVVGGTVTHFGHRHYRRNRYDAAVRLIPVDDTWKIAGIEVYGEERVQ